MKRLQELTRSGRESGLATGSGPFRDLRLLTQGLRRSHEADDAIARVEEIAAREETVPARGLIFTVGATGVEYVREATAAETVAAERV